MYLTNFLLIILVIFGCSGNTSSNQNHNLSPEEKQAIKIFDMIQSKQRLDSLYSLFSDIYKLENDSMGTAKLFLHFDSLYGQMTSFELVEDISTVKSPYFKSDLGEVYIYNKCSFPYVGGKTFKGLIYKVFFEKDTLLFNFIFVEENSQIKIACFDSFSEAYPKNRFIEKSTNDIIESALNGNYIKIYENFSKKFIERVSEKKIKLYFETIGIKNINSYKLIAYKTYIENDVLILETHYELNFKDSNEFLTLRFEIDNEKIILRGIIPLFH